MPCPVHASPGYEGQRPLSCSHLGPGQLLLFSRTLAKVTFNRDSVLQIDSLDGVYFIVEGVMKLVSPFQEVLSGKIKKVPTLRMLKERSRLVATLETGSFFGESSVFPEQSNGWMVYAENTVECLYVMKGIFMSETSKPVIEAIREEAKFKMMYYMGTKANPRHGDASSDDEDEWEDPLARSRAARVEEAEEKEEEQEAEAMCTKKGLGVSSELEGKVGPLHLKLLSMINQYEDDEPYAGSKRDEEEAEASSLSQSAYLQDFLADAYKMRTHSSGRPVADPLQNRFAQSLPGASHPWSRASGPLNVVSVTRQLSRSQLIPSSDNSNPQVVEQYSARMPPSSEDNDKHTGTSRTQCQGKNRTILAEGNSKRKNRIIELRGRLRRMKTAWSSPQGLMNFHSSWKYVPEDEGGGKPIPLRH
ncbi:hypothetical protein CYMTET_43640 [Cymbomonas tetramitiformis]|uniref:Cyclic nucleotide-binding domain-containing protein n=1 Tax=Cymbomonas tetramitiformis TaxID=36881 RepID=A0AAE0C3U6_9CHLO|nr:hypothetical protein CYMTET_43640 [Cymbomonas tetramitiformis]